MTRNRTCLSMAAVLLYISVASGQLSGPPKQALRPVSYGIVVDNSGSYRMLLDRVINFTHQVTEKNSEEDQTFLVTFVDGARTKVRQELTSDKKDIYEAIDNMFVEGGQSAVLDAVRYSIDYLTANSADKSGHGRTLLLVSDGDDTASTAKLESVLTAAKEGSVRIIVVGISDEKLNPKLLDRLAKGSGGVAFYPKTPKETLAIVGDVAAAIRGN